MRESFIQGHHGVAVFFDLEKAYDTTWKYGIMKDLHTAGLSRKDEVLMTRSLCADLALGMLVKRTRILSEMKTFLNVFTVLVV